MQTLQQVFQNAGTWQQAMYGKFFILIDTANPVTIRLIRSGKVMYTASGVLAGFWTVTQEPFDYFEIDNAYAGGAVQIGISESEKGGYQRVGGKIDAKMISAQSVVNVPMKTVPQNTETQLCLANPGRASLRIWNNGTADIFIGAPGLNVVDAAIKLAPGDLWVETDAPAAAWVALQTASSTAQPVKVQEIIW